MPGLNEIFTECLDCCDVIINLIDELSMSILFHFTRLRGGFFEQIELYMLELSLRHI